ncbi:plakophilin-1-like [Garra rufa]|uniref:plakophilin-1-like n=1 Tax=Garra rufa TaxID=137080 RepID=UPI003CCE8A6E
MEEEESGREWNGAVPRFAERDDRDEMDGETENDIQYYDSKADSDVVRAVNVSNWRTLLIVKGAKGTAALRHPRDPCRPEKRWSLENCVCILHNLTYQLETEMPSLFTKINALASHARNRSSSSDAGPIGCFSSQSQKLQQESGFDYPVMEDNNPKGTSWLFHSKALQMYLNLLSSSERDATLEASCGALQNLTANDGIVSNVLSHTIVQKLNGLKYISPLLQSPNAALQNSAIALLGNLSRSNRTNKTMARQTLPQLVGFLNSGLAKSDSSPEYDSTMATALHSAHSMMKADPDMIKGLLNNGLINSLNNLSLNQIGLPKSSTAAGVLLHSLWSEKNIQSFLKKQGMNKKSFVNDITSAAFKSLHVVD